MNRTDAIHLALAVAIASGAAAVFPQLGSLAAWCGAGLAFVGAASAVWSSWMIMRSPVHPDEDGCRQVRAPDRCGRTAT
jgi:hypothetical protein